jgi:hypothetical protein
MNSIDLFALLNRNETLEKAQIFSGQNPIILLIGMIVMISMCLANESFLTFTRLSNNKRLYV